MLRARVTDDRGRRVRLAPHDWGAWRADTPERRRLLGASTLPWGDPDARPGRAEVVHGIVAGAVALPVLLASAAAPAYLAFRSGLAWWATVLWCVPLGALPALVTVCIARALSARGVAKAHRRAGLCASCGYSLQEIEPAPDGCRVCPECGAAWRPEPPRRAARD